jgi:hypothetical protein
MRTIGAVLFASLLGGCFADDPPEIWVTSIEITGETDPLSRLDVELHLYDADTDQFIGCAGQDHGMERVDASDVRYPIEAWFYDVALDRRVHPHDLELRDVVIEVWEDDGNPCPSPATSLDGDDPVGISGPLPGDGIGEVGPLSFGNVIYLEVEVY